MINSYVFHNCVSVHRMNFKTCMDEILVRSYAPVFYKFVTVKQLEADYWLFNILYNVLNGVLYK